MEGLAQYLQSLQRDILVLIFNTHNRRLRQAGFSGESTLWHAAAPMPDK
jgi:hypothetical protein